MMLWFLIAAYACSMAGANLCLKYAAMAHGTAAWAWFAAANVVGFLCVASLPFALKLAPANVVYALAIGLGYLVLQVAGFLLFREPLSTWQWTGITLVGMGTFLLQLK
jgi:multidrug transporter EmrE-like cation transporter